MKVFERIISLRNKLIGSPFYFSMESRLFHALCIMAFTGLSINALVNYFLHRSLLAVLMILLLGVSFFVYYLSRKKKLRQLPLFLFFTFANSLLVLNYYYGSGINGPTFFLAILCLVLTTAIMPQKQKGYWIALNLIIIVSLLLLEFFKPTLIIQSYATRKTRFIDFIYAYLLIAFLVVFGISFIRKNYNYEKNIAEQKANELAKINEAKDKLFSIIAHDLRAPLNSIQNYLEVLSEINIDHNNRKHIEKELLTATRHSSEMLFNLLAWAKTQMMGISVNLTTVYPAKTLANTIELQRAVAKEKGIDLYQSIPQMLCVLADADMLQLVVRNLLNNAIKFTNAGGEISVNAADKNNACIIIIKDNGIGISPENQANLFSLKAASTYGTQGEKGMGLGLALCKNCIELQQGNIYFESTAGIGTSFYINLKIA